MTGAACCGP